MSGPANAFLYPIVLGDPVQSLGTLSGRAVKMLETFLLQRLYLMNFQFDTDELMKQTTTIVVLTSTPDPRMLMALVHDLRQRGFLGSFCFAYLNEQTFRVPIDFQSALGIARVVRLQGKPLKDFRTIEDLYVRGVL